MIELPAQQTEFAAPFHASPLPFSYGSQSRSPTPVRPARERKNPGRYSSNEYDLDLMETESASSEDNAYHHTPIFRFKSPDCSLRVSSSPESFSVTDRGQPLKFMKLSPCASVGYEMGVAMSEYRGVNGGHDDGVVSMEMDVVEEMRQRLACSKREQFEIARHIATKNQKALKKQQEQENKVDMLALPKGRGLV